MASTTRALCTILALTAAFALASKEPTCQSSDGGCDAVPISPNVPDLRGKFPSTVRPEHKSWNPLGVTPKEWEARTEIAAVYRGPVSYTHLRAHETPEHLVCRLLLEKKKKKITITLKIQIKS
eukprot:TRINITY_DN27747_c0_g1_i2.p1 TRINITY_DN27747_c0_g1~~TRINITY_DN27747_c0_g1_i2.p1  ORF type:complete len:123 (+),score=27.24 TRINITY_DN27747_c0_g1_i2:287-655(+)